MQKFDYFLEPKFKYCALVHFKFLQIKQ